MDSSNAFGIGVEAFEGLRPDFLLDFVALTHFMRLSNKKQELL
jgi:hypothetical protein